MRLHTSPCSYFFLLCFLFSPPTIFAGQKIDLTMERAVEIAMENSYQIRQLKLGIERSRQWLKAEQAGLKSKIYMNIKAPEFMALSDYKWDSNLNKDVIVKQNTQRWWANLAIRQPVIFFGYPTNGYLSLNNTVYQYDQRNGGFWDTNYYNRYFLKFEQPFFQPNRLKNDLEEAQLSLEENELNFLDDQVDLIEEISRDYYELFGYSYTDIILERYIHNLQRIKQIANCKEKDNGDKSIDCIQIQIELTNLTEKRAQNMSDYRLQATRVKQRLRLEEMDSIVVHPEIRIKEVKVDLNQAIQYGHTLRPRMRLLDINRRKREIDLTNVKGWNAFQLNVEMTYGLEKQDESYRELWNEFDNSYSVTVNAYLPIWDWGQRKARITAQEITIRKTELYQEEMRSRIESEIKTAYQNLQEYQQRALNMQENMVMAEQITALSIEQYSRGEISLQDLLQNLNRQKETEENFLEAYLGYRKSLIGLTIDTYYDYENDIALLDKFRSSS
ncbi:TolC family protein [candidate division KSB1 bacterium]|nr:TolC family protein [candidate division KSB1 bacterium]RQW04377.1 MAG: TolC family protein [candidate division KSB1 bacterium]